MKKIIAIVLTAVMLVSVLAVNVFAAANDTNILLEIGDVFGTLVQSETVDVANGGEFTLTATLASAVSTSADGTFIAVKTAAGQVDQRTALPDGTVVTVTSLELDGTKVDFDAAKGTRTVENGVLNGQNAVLLLLKLFGENALTGDVPAEFKTVTVTFTVDNPNAAPADDNAADEPADTTPEPDTAAPAADPEPVADPTPAPAEPSAPATGLALAVVPAVVAMAAVAVSKKH